MGKGSSGHKQNNAAKRKRAIYQAENRYAVNKRRKAAKEQRKNEKLALKGKGILAKVSVPETQEATVSGGTGGTNGTGDSAGTV